MPPDHSPDPASRLQELFADFLARAEAGEQPEFDTLCREHPGDADALRTMRAEWDRTRVLTRLVSARSGSLAARLEKAYGEGVDPTVQLDPGPAETPVAAMEELVRRLSQHAPTTSRYKLEGEVARGGMGAILKVWDQDLRRHLAMKVVLGKDATASTGVTPPVDQKQLARFLEEAQVTGQLDHPGIVPVHELGLESDGRVFFTMKLVKGRDLKKIFDLVFESEEGWNETRALGVILKVCEAMAYAHKKGVIHRDLKPANVMVGNFGEVYVMDWGLARVIGRKDLHDIRLQSLFATAFTQVKSERRETRDEAPDSPIVTMDGDVMGTPAYMPPEQARGETEKLTSRSDVYAIGSMLYHLLARRMPYVAPGVRVSNRTVLARVLDGPPTPLSKLRKDVPAELVAICEKAMERESSRRYADTLALAEDLRAYLEHRVVAAYETGAWAETRKWVQRNKPLAAALAGAMLILVAGIVFSTVKTREAELARSETTAMNTRLIEANEAALANAKLATQEANDVLSLSAIEELRELVERADALWPAFPAKLADYDRWLADAKVLIDGSATHPSLRDHEAKLAEIRQRAKPLTPEQVESDRRSGPSFAEWEKARARLTWTRRMLGEEPWPTEPEVEATLANAALPTDADGLNDMARPLVDTDPGKIVYGSEIKALILARRAVAAAKDAERAEIRDTLARALYRSGRFDEALAEAQRAVDDAKDARKEQLAASLKRLQERVALWTGGDARSKAAGEASKLAARVADLERAVNERRRYEFDDAQARWWHLELSVLVSDLRAFADEKSGGLYSSGTSENHGWGIVKRAEFARTIADRSVSGAEAKRRWDEAIAAVAKSTKYGGFSLKPALGLLPIGEDPDSHLWEFAHLQTGDEAQRGADGKLVLKEQTGIVLVLIPGGKFWMGAQNTDPTGRNFDPQALDYESAVHEVTLSPYFLSKYEMTQGQWERIAGRNPSSYDRAHYAKNWNRAGKSWSALHPVEQVSWTECMQLMSRLGLTLPSEAQWENGARAGTETAWWTGSDRTSLQGAGNLSDTYGKEHGNSSWVVWEKDLDDGNTVHAEVGSYRPNPFGLHDVVGNVWEWCRNPYVDHYSPASEGDDERQVSGIAHGVFRGGSFDYAASLARSASRSHDLPDSHWPSTGLRPAMAIAR